VTDFSHLVAIQKAHEDDLLALPNVRGVGIGVRIKDGKPTDETVITVHVVKKRPLEELGSDEVVPPELRLPGDGRGDVVPTDVFEVGEIRPHNDGVAPFNGPARPIQPGYQLARQAYNPDGSPITDREAVGTAGLVMIASDGNPHILSNTHVLAVPHPDGTADPQDIGQPDLDSIIGRTSAWWGVKAGGVDNWLDAALTTVDPSVGAIPDFPGGWGRMQGWYNFPAQNWEVQKFGRTTGWTKGDVWGINQTVTFDYYATGSADTKFQGVTWIHNGSTPPSDHGDSGAMWVTLDHHAAALNFAGNSADTAYAFPMGTVMNNFPGANMAIARTDDGEWIHGEAMGSPHEGLELPTLGEPERDGSGGAAAR
jgi:hypothetical protein